MQKRDVAAATIQIEDSNQSLNIFVLLNYHLKPMNKHLQLR